MKITQIIKTHNTKTEQELKDIVDEQRHIISVLPHNQTVVHNNIVRACLLILQLRGINYANPM